MIRSKLRVGSTASSDHVLAELSAMLETDDREEGWAVIGSSSSTDTFRLQGVQGMEFLKICLKWGDNMSNLVMSGALKNFLDPPFLAGHCSHSFAVP
jgi:hypothetical protein